MELSQEEMEKLREGLDRSIGYFEAANYTGIHFTIVREYGKKLGYPSYYELDNMWKFFNREIEDWIYTGEFLTTVREYGKKLGYPLYYELNNMWKFFNREIED